MNITVCVSLLKVSVGKGKRTNLALFKKVKYIALNDQSLGGEVMHKINMEISIFLLLLHSTNTLTSVEKKKKLPIMFG